MLLEPELVPKTCWYSNVRSCVSPNDWDILRKECFTLINNLCEICGGKGNKWPVECHEVWEYDEANKIQKLVRLIALCPQCHQVKHPGLANIKGKTDEVIQQLIKVNKITKQQANDLLGNAFQEWERKSMYQWKIDLSFLDGKNIKYHSDRS